MFNKSCRNTHHELCHVCRLDLLLEEEAIRAAYQPTQLLLFLFSTVCRTSDNSRKEGFCTGTAVELLYNIPIRHLHHEGQGTVIGTRALLLQLQLL